MGNNIDLQIKIDKALKKVWEENVVNDYNKDYLLKEDTLKNSIYYHLRSELGDGFLDRHRLRIFTEFYMGTNKNGKKQIADIAIVRLKYKRELDESYYLKNRIDEILTIIELKYKGNNEKAFREDISKTKEYTKIDKCKNTQFYLGFIYEAFYEESNGGWLYKNQRECWGKDKVTELTAHYSQEKGRFVSNIISHTKMNAKMNAQ